MITEDYVSFETAKLLKEKGFDEPCDRFYRFDKPKTIYTGTSYRNSEIGDKQSKVYNTCTQQMAMKWLREAHNLFIEIKYATSLFSQPHTTMYFQICYMSLDYNISGKNMLPDNYIREYYTSYEGACEAAIKYCLENLI